MIKTLLLYDGKMSSAERIAAQLSCMIGNACAAEVGDAPASLEPYGGFCFVFNYYGAVTAGRTRAFLREHQAELRDKRIAMVGIGFSDIGYTMFVTETEKIAGLSDLAAIFISGEAETPRVGYELYKMMRVADRPLEDEQLLEEIESYISSHNTLALATSGDGYVRCTPLEYHYRNRAFYIVTEGGCKFRGILENGSAAAAIFDPYTTPDSVHGLQFLGKAEVIPVGSDEYRETLAEIGVTAEALEAQAVTLFLLKLLPLRYEYLNVAFRARGLDVNQTLETEFLRENWEKGARYANAAQKAEQTNEEAAERLRAKLENEDDTADGDTAGTGFTGEDTADESPADDDLTAADERPADDDFDAVDSAAVGSAVVDSVGIDSTDEDIADIEFTGEDAADESPADDNLAAVDLIAAGSAADSVTADSVTVDSADEDLADTDFTGEDAADESPADGNSAAADSVAVDSADEDLAGADFTGDDAAAEGSSAAAGTPETSADGSTAAPEFRMPSFIQTGDRADSLPAIDMSVIDGLEEGRRTFYKSDSENRRRMTGRKKPATLTDPDAGQDELAEELEDEDSPVYDDALGGISGNIRKQSAEQPKKERVAAKEGSGFLAKLKTTFRRMLLIDGENADREYDGDEDEPGELLEPVETPEHELTEQEASRHFRDEDFDEADEADGEDGWNEDEAETDGATERSEAEDSPERGMKRFRASLGRKARRSEAGASRRKKRAPRREKNEWESRRASESRFYRFRDDEEDEFDDLE